MEFGRTEKVQLLVWRRMRRGYTSVKKVKGFKHYAESALDIV